MAIPEIMNIGKRGRDQTARVSNIEDNDGEKKYSPPWDTMKSNGRVIEPLRLEGSRAPEIRDCPLLAPMMGSKPTPICLNLNVKAVKRLEQ